MWAFYWIDVISKILPVFVLGFLSFAILGVLLMLPSSDMDDYRAKLYLKKVFKTLICSWLIICSIIVFIPSKQTMYIMLGLYGGDKIINSETGKKLASIVEHELDSALAKYVKKESK